MTDNNYHVAWCPFCNQGWVDIIKDALSDELLLMCNECDTLWGQPIDVKLSNPLIRETEIKVVEPSLVEITEMGWDRFLISIDDL